MLLKPLHFIGKHAPLMLFFGVFLGLLLPWLSEHLRPLLAPMVTLILMGTLLRIDWAAIRATLGRTRATFVTFCWLQLISPAVTWAIVTPLGLPPALAAGIILMAAAPPILSAAAIALLVGLDGALALVGGLISTLLAPLTVPALALWLLDLDLHVSAWAMMSRLAVIVSLAVVGAVVLRRWSGPARLAARAKEIDGLIVVAMLVFAVAIMDGVTDSFLADPGRVLLWTAAAFVANPLLQALGYGVSWRAGHRQALTIGLITGNCNMGLILAGLPPDADPGIALFFAVAQFPMFMLPAIMLPLYRRLVKLT